ncbi:recombinase family protein (plasmid) [Paraclostridium ghonii]|uniref:recombinase family protein n=1 Tax=Paraclostridium ghonii TaxID=29358 RepID=UPI00202CBE00|nr:recombinase family protein [Paeniclostridium ghonii]MCM0167409.1 recombinase family protein [Paeniclostridium ghonii]
MIYGYARVSTKSQEDNTSLENQIKILNENGCSKVFYEVHTGATMERPQWNELEKILKQGDTIVITKLDRFTRSTEKGIQKIKALTEKGIKVNILNMGIVDLSSSMGKMMFTVLTAFAEYEKDCIVERMKEGKAIAKQDINFKEGRPKVHKDSKKAHALELLRSGKTYKQVEQMTGISKSTLIRYKNKVEIEGLS